MKNKTAATATPTCKKDKFSFCPAPGTTWIGAVALLTAEVSLGGSGEVVVGVTSVGMSVSVEVGGSKISVLEVLEIDVVELSDIATSVLSTSVEEVIVANVEVKVGSLGKVVVSNTGGSTLKDIVAPQRASGVPLGQHPAFVQ